MTRAEISASVIIMIADQTGSLPDDINEKTEIKNDLGMDSLDLIEGILSVEKHFDIYIPDREVDEIKNIGDLVDKIEEQSNLKSNP